MGKAGDAPAAPDYVAAAKAQGDSNLDAATATAKLNNPNISNPYGSQTVTYGNPVFDQAGYDKAVAAYNTAGPSSEPQYLNQTVSDGPGSDSSHVEMVLNPNYQPNMGSMPTREQFTSNPTELTANITQTLNPESQAIFDAQQQTKLGLANLSNSVIPQIQNTLGSEFQFNGPAVRTSLGNYGQATGSVANSGNINTGPNAGDYGLKNSFDAGGNVQSSLAPAGAINQGAKMGQYGYASGLAGDQYGSAGSVSPNTYGQAGGIDSNAYGNASGMRGDQYGSASGQLNLADVAKMPVNAGQTGQAAIMSRLAPQIEQSNAAYANTLKNQGITLGSEAFTNAMRVHDQQNNDLLSQAALQGINLDLSANQQGYNQALSSGQFGNQAIAQNYAQGLGAQQLTNQAQAQNYARDIGAQQLQNAAVGQNFGQGLQAQNQANAAIGQNFGQGLQAKTISNQATAQNYGQDIATQAAQNAAQQQGFGQNLASGQFANQAQAQQFGQNQAQGAFYNTAQGQGLSQQIAAQQAQNAAQQQQYGQNLSNVQLQNQAQNQNFNQGLASSQFGNTAQAQALQQQLQQRQLPLNEIAALMSGSQIQNPQFQGYTGGGQVGAAPLFSATQANNNAALQGYGMQNASNNSFMNGLMGLGGNYMVGQGLSGAGSAAAQAAAATAAANAGYTAMGANSADWLVPLIAAA